jgi:hypothetical protein
MPASAVNSRLGVGRISDDGDDGIIGRKAASYDLRW